MVITDIAIPILIFIFGLCIGSFLNVCIYRLPVGKSIAFPPSHCLNCEAAIRIYDNVPVIGWLLLKGRCRDCGIRISWRYPLVELLTGGFALCTCLKFGPTIEAAIYFVFITVLIVITFIDIDHRIILDRVTLPGIPLAFVGYTFITGKEGMGGGDIKLLAMIGALCGWLGVLFTIFFGSVLGSVTGIATMRGSGQGTKLAIPFGPFLSVGAIGYIFFGPEMIHWYLSTMGR